MDNVNVGRRLKEYIIDGDLNGVKNIFDNGWKIHNEIITDCEWNTHNAFTLAASAGHLDVVQYLLTSPELTEHADIHADDDLALREACGNGHLDVVNYLLTSLELKDHADIHAGNDYALHSACSNGHLGVMQCLIQNGADFESMAPLEEWFSNHSDIFMLETIEGMKSEVSQPLMEKHGEYVFGQYMNENIDVPDNLAQPLMQHHAFHVMEQYMAADRNLPENLAKHIPDIEQEQELYL